MAETNYSNVLPNPSNPIAYDGGSNSENAGYTGAAGYASVKVDASFKTMSDQTNSGILVSRSKAAQSWSVSINYNPLTREEFSPIYSFLLEKQGMLKPFFVPLPQYDNPQDSTLAAQSPAVAFQTTSLVSAGQTRMTVDASGYNSSTNGTLRPGDMFTITDPNNSNHTKAYKITRVETNVDYVDDGSQPTTTAQLRLHFSPPLQKEVSNNSTINYINPLIKVIMKSDIISYDLKTDNLYSFSLNLQEVQ